MQGKIVGNKLFTQECKEKQLSRKEKILHGRLTTKFNAS